MLVEYSAKCTAEPITKKGELVLAGLSRSVSMSEWAKPCRCELDEFANCILC
jgi:hypothetical protein